LLINGLFVGACPAHADNSNTVTALREGLNRQVAKATKKLKIIPLGVLGVLAVKYQTASLSLSASQALICDCLAISVHRCPSVVEIQAALTRMASSSSQRA
jgi:hypothetical protein